MRRETVRLVVPIALKEMMAELAPEFTRATGHRFDIAHRLNPEVPDHVASGAPWDIALTNPWHVAEIIAANRASPDDHYPFCRSPLALARRGATAVPARRSEEDIARTLRAARRIAITGTGTSGEKFRTLATMLGVWEALEDRVVPMAGGGPMNALLAHDVDLAALPLTNIAPVQGVFAAAICPPGLGVHVDISLCLAPDASRVARDFADWLVEPARDVWLGRLGAERLSLVQRSVRDS